MRAPPRAPGSAGCLWLSCARALLFQPTVLPLCWRIHGDQKRQKPLPHRSTQQLPDSSGHSLLSPAPSPAAGGVRSVPPPWVSGLAMWPPRARVLSPGVWPPLGRVLWQRRAGVCAAMHSRCPPLAPGSTWSWRRSGPESAGNRLLREAQPLHILPVLATQGLHLQTGYQ